jgi:polygalacturonase
MSFVGNHAPSHDPPSRRCSLRTDKPPFSPGLCIAPCRRRADRLRRGDHVQDSGAVGDGFTDDAVAIQTALNLAVNAGGGVVSSQS